MFEAKNITVEAEGKTLVRGASFSIPEGEIRALTGSNGSGKSSLVNAIFGHPKYSIPEGEILLGGENITALPPDKKAKKGLFLSLQHVPEIEGVTFANFLFRGYKELRNSPELSVLDFQKTLEERAEKFGFPKGFLKRFVNAGLSGGEKKLSEAFQLALFEPAFAFLDEIDSGVDNEALEKIFEIIRALKEKGTGFLLITHSEKTLSRIAPAAVYAMKNGEITI